MALGTFAFTVSDSTLHAERARGTGMAPYIPPLLKSIMDTLQSIKYQGIEISRKLDAYTVELQRIVAADASLSGASKMLIGTVEEHIKR